MELARHWLRELGCDLGVREEIAALVRYHGRPPYLLEKSDPAHEVISLSWLVNHRLLYLFALADTRGRRTREMSRPEENLHLWKMVAEENGCFDQPYAFANDHARFLFYRGARFPACTTRHKRNTAARSRSCQDCPARGRTRGWLGIVPACRWFRWTISVRTLTLMRRRIKVT